MTSILPPRSSNVMPHNNICYFDYIYCYGALHILAFSLQTIPPRTHRHLSGSIRRGRNGTYNPMMLLITHSLLSGKELAEEKNLIINGIIPVFSIVFTGTGNKIMIYLAAQQPIVKVFVHIQKKIILTAIYN